MQLYNASNHFLNEPYSSLGSIPVDIRKKFAVVLIKEKCEQANK